MKRVLTGLAALVVVLTGAEDAIAQTRSAPGQKATKPGDTKVAARTAVGRVKATFPDTILVTTKIDGREVEWTFGIDTGTRVHKASREITATELRAGDPVQVRYVEQDGKTMAQHIAVTTPVKPKTEVAPAQKK